MGIFMNNVTSGQVANNLILIHQINMFIWRMMQCKVYHMIMVNMKKGIKSLIWFFRNILMEYAKIMQETGAK